MLVPDERRFALRTSASFFDLRSNSDALCRDKASRNGKIKAIDWIFRVPGSFSPLARSLVRLQGGYAMIDRLLSVTAMFVVLSSPAFAQDEPSSLSQGAPLMQALPDVSEAAPGAVTEFADGQVQGQLVASDLIGRTLFNTGGEEIGPIEDLAIDEGRTVFLVVVDVSQLVGTQKQVAFGFELLGFEQAENDIRLVAAIDRAVIETAPSFASLADSAVLNDMQGATMDADQPEAADPQSGAQ
jgi:hypothetical protein